MSSLTHFNLLVWSPLCLSMHHRQRRTKLQTTKNDDDARPIELHKTNNKNKAAAGMFQK